MGPHYSFGRLCRHSYSSKHAVNWRMTVTKLRGAFAETFNIEAINHLSRNKRAHLVSYV